jgi:acyl-CoA dehydrogenase
MSVFGLPDRAYELQRAVRAFVDGTVIPAEDGTLARNVDRLDEVCSELRRKARTAGVFAPDLWEQWKGSRLGWQVRHLVLEEVGRSPLGAGALHCAPPDMPNIDLLAAVANPEQRVRYLQPLINAEVRSCFAMTEPTPGAGSDPSMLKTTARLAGRRWVINGHKWFISGAIGARFAIVIATTDSGPTMFIVESTNPGWRIQRSLRSLDSHQLGGHAEIRIVDCIVDDECRLGETGKALVYAQMRLEPARLAHCMRMVGRAQRVTELAQQYLRRRQSFGSPLAELQNVQTLVADSHIDLYAARLMTWHVAAKMDAGESVKQDSAIAKVFVSEAVCRIADRAVQLAGASGTLVDEPIGQFFQEVRPFRIYDGASEVHRAAIGRRVLRSSHELADLDPLLMQG